MGGAASTLDLIKQKRGLCTGLTAKLEFDPLVDGRLELGLSDLAREHTMEGDNNSFGEMELDWESMGVAFVDLGVKDPAAGIAHLNRHFVLADETGVFPLSGLGSLDLLGGKGKLACGQCCWLCHELGCVGQCSDGLGTWTWCWQTSGQSTRQRAWSHFPFWCSFVGGLQKEKENPMFCEILVFLLLFLVFLLLLKVPKGTPNLRKFEGKGKAS